MTFSDKVLRKRLMRKVDGPQKGRWLSRHTPDPEGLVTMTTEHERDAAVFPSDAEAPDGWEVADVAAAVIRGLR